MSLSLHAQIKRTGNTLSIDGVNYRMGDELLRRYSGPPTYDHLDAYTEDLNIFLETFVRDALIHERQIDGVTPLTYGRIGPTGARLAPTTGLTFQPDSFWNGPGAPFGERTITECAEESRVWNPDHLPYPRWEYQCIRYRTRTIPASRSGQLPGGTSVQRASDRGYNVNIRRSYWQGTRYFNPSRAKISRINLMYHELGHALLELNHDCSTGDNIMYTGACPAGASFGNRTFYESLIDLFTTPGIPFPGSTLTRKGPSELLEIHD